MKSTHSRESRNAPDPSVRVLTGTEAGGEPRVRFRSAHVVLEESFHAGRLVTRFWSAAGQVLPERYAQQVAWGADEPADSFVVAIDGRDLAGGYEWVAAEEEADTSGLHHAEKNVLCLGVRLRHPATGIVIIIHTRLDGSPFIVRWLEIINASPRPAAITAACPFGGMAWSRRTDEHLRPVPPGCTQASPFLLAYNHLFTWGNEGDFWFEPLPDGLRRIDGGRIGRSGWGRPAFWIRDLVTGQTLVGELAWGGNYELIFDCRVRAAPGPSRLFFRVGLSGQDAALRVLLPRETVVTPSAHVTLFHAADDIIVQATHAHVRTVVMPDPVPGRHIEIEANHRGYLCDRENETGLKADQEVAAAAGAEMYVVDAGWYGGEPNRWWNNAGDWHPGPWLPNGLEPVVEHANALGMRFGLWMEIEAAGDASSLAKEHPEWLLRRDGKPIGTGRALDFSNPEVVRWAEGEVGRIIRTYRLDMYRIDHNHLLDPSGNRRYEGYTEDLTWRYYEGLYGMLVRLRSAFPLVVFQNCAGGGGRLDWGTLGLFHNSELSDWMRMPRGLRILNGITMSLPPEILLRTFGTEAAELDLDGDVDTQLRLACLARPIFRGIAPDLQELSPFLKQRIEHHVGVYKDFIRPLLPGCRVFHHTPFLPLYGDAGWCVLEYATPGGERAVIGVFRTAPAGSGQYFMKPRGVMQGGSYRVTLDNANDSFVASGRELVRNGIEVRLESAISSELILLEHVPMQAQPTR